MIDFNRLSPDIDNNAAASDAKHAEVIQQLWRKFHEQSAPIDDAIYYLHKSAMMHGKDIIKLGKPSRQMSAMMLR